MIPFVNATLVDAHSVNLEIFRIAVVVAKVSKKIEQVLSLCWHMLKLKSFDVATNSGIQFAAMELE
jgi:hypothetical protein